MEGIIGMGEISLKTRAYGSIHPRFAGNDDGALYEASIDDIQ